MGFYKREGEQLLQSETSVLGPDYSLTIENHGEHTYPVDGWCWFDTLDEALDKLPRVSPTAVVSRFQAKAALLGAGLLPQVQAMIDAADPATRLAWNEVIEFRRDSPLLNTLATALGLDSAALDQLFVAASKITA